MRGCGILLLLLGLLGMTAGQGFGLQDGDKEPPGASTAVEKKDICELLCEYANATGKNTGGLGEDGEPIPEEDKANAAKKLGSRLQACLKASSQPREGTCTCIGLDGRSYPFTYKIRARSGNSKVTGSADVVVAIGGNKIGSGAAGNATAINTGDGDAIAVGGNNCGSGEAGNATATAGKGNSLAVGGSAANGVAGDATAVSGSGFADANGGNSGGDNPGGSGSASSESGVASASGGNGGNAGGSGVVAGGPGGQAAASYGGNLFAASGITPVPAGFHGAGSSASAGSGFGSSSTGGWLTN